MNPGQLIDAFQFQDQFVFDQQIDAITTIQLDSLVCNRLWMLREESNVIPLEFMRETLFIR